MSARTEAARRLATGTRWMVTNHYITRPDHPCYGTRVETVRSTNGSAFFLGEGRRIPWPKASQVQADDNGTVRLYGGGAGQSSDDLWMSFVPCAGTS